MKAIMEQHLSPQVTYALAPHMCYKGCISTSLCLWMAREELLKGRCKGNKWRISSLLNGALEGLWLWVVGYKTQWLGCSPVLVHWLSWQLCSLGAILGNTSGHALCRSFGTGALPGPTRGGRKPSPTSRSAPPRQSERCEIVSRGELEKINVALLEVNLEIICLSLSCVLFFFFVSVTSFSFCVGCTVNWVSARLDLLQRFLRIMQTCVWNVSIWVFNICRGIHVSLRAHMHAHKHVDYFSPWSLEVISGLLKWSRLR